MNERTAPIETPQLLLEHHLKTLRLPTMLREYRGPRRTGLRRWGGSTIASHDCARWRTVDYPTLPAAHGGAGAAGPRAPRHRTPHPAGEVPGHPRAWTASTSSPCPRSTRLWSWKLARCELLLRKENVLLLGNSGTGKTHIALALGLAACQGGHRVRFTTASALVSELIEARDEEKLLRFQRGPRQAYLLAGVGEADRQLRVAQRR